jgi:hypothetical protein
MGCPPKSRNGYSQDRCIAHFMRTELSIWGATSAVNANLQQTLEPENWQKYQSASVSAR